MNEQQKVVTLLDTAIEKLEREWGARASDTITCLWLALDDASNAWPKDEGDSLCLTAEAFVAARIPKKYIAHRGQARQQLGHRNLIINWNDEPDRTKHQVLAVIRRARDDAAHQAIQKT
jgi:hypothetical protein